MDHSHYIEQYEQFMRNNQLENAEPKEQLTVLLKTMKFKNFKLLYEQWLEGCLVQEDWESLNRLIFQQMRYQLVPGSSSGYDHCKNILQVFNALACGDDETVSRILPVELGLTKNGYRFFVVASNLFIAIWYEDEEWLQKARNEAEKFVTTKKPQWERSSIAFLLALLEEDVEAMSSHLQNVCTGYMRASFSQGLKRMCLPAHGLYSFAQKQLPEHIRSQLLMPNHKSFSQGFAKWRNTNPQPKLNMYVTYPEPLHILNCIYNTPVARSVISQSKPAQLKKIWFLDEQAMLESFVESVKLV